MVVWWFGACALKLDNKILILVLPLLKHVTLARNTFYLSLFICKVGLMTVINFLGSLWRLNEYACEPLEWSLACEKYSVIIGCYYSWFLLIFFLAPISCQETSTPKLFVCCLSHLMCCHIFSLKDDFILLWSNIYIYLYSWDICSVEYVLGWPAILICSGLTGFSGHRTFNAKTRKILGKPEQVVHLTCSRHFTFASYLPLIGPKLNWKASLLWLCHTFLFIG